jgi:glycosyltransferase involved in cell wall biosynthesis
MKESGKPVILTFINNYLPGYKAGGIPRSMINTVENLSEYYDFRIVTRDRDLGDTATYSTIIQDQWQPVGSATVFYLSPQTSNFGNLRNLILKTKHHVLYLNSFFDTFTIKVLLIRKFGGIPFSPVIVAPRGEFASAAIKLKYLRKFIFIRIARLIGLYNNVTWHASSEFEETDIKQRMKIQNSSIHTALDLPTKSIPNDSLTPAADPTDFFEALKVVFVSRIARVKNLEYALQILSNVKEKVLFDIYGTLEDLRYWRECQDLIDKLPGNIKVNYMGVVSPIEVVRIFSFYDLFLFPTGGENYGHVIAESLSAGTPVLISDKTPWKNLQNNNLGWDISLDKMAAFVEIVENYAKLSPEERTAKRDSIKAMIEEYLLDPVVLEANRQLFLKRVINDIV